MNPMNISDQNKIKEKVEILEIKQLTYKKSKRFGSVNSMNKSLQI